MQEPLNRLRAQLYETPSEERWRSLCRQMERWQDPDSLDMALDYIKEHTAHWPDEICLAPSSWIQRALRGTPPAALRMIRHLVLRNQNPQKALDIVLKARPRVLELHQIPLQNEDLQTLLDSSLPLRALVLSQNRLQEHGSLLSEASWWPDLTHLALERNGLRNQGLQALLAQNPPRALEELRLASNGLREGAAQTLREATWLTTLTGLDFGGAGASASGANILREAGGIALAQAPHLSSLLHLNLANQKLDLEGSRAIVQSRYLHELTYLNLGNNQASPLLASALSGAEHLAALNFLELSHNHLEDTGLYELSEATWMENLEHLGLASNAISVQGAQELASWENLQELKTLDLSQNFFGNEGAEALLEAPFLSSLEALHLAGTRLDDRVLGVFLSAQHQLESVKVLDLRNNDFSPETARELELIFPEAIVQTYQGSYPTAPTF